MRIYIDSAEREAIIEALASVRDPAEIEALAALGVATATLPPVAPRQLPDSDLTSAAAQTFNQDARVIL